MKISTKARYGIKALLDLGLHGQQDHVALKAVAERQGISERYLEQVFASMRKSGLIRSVKGPQGGYLLACDPRATTLYQIITALEGFETFSDSGETPEDVADSLVNALVWQPIDAIIRERLEQLMLSALIDAYREAKAPHDMMFFI